MTLTAIILSSLGFAFLFAAIWILHRPLDVHSCPSRAARNVHRVLEWALTLWGLVLAAQIVCLFHPCFGVGCDSRAAARIGRNKDAMRRFEACINANDLALGRKLIPDKAAFATPVSPEPLHGAEGYLSVVSLMRESFPDVQWKLEDMVAAVDESIERQKTSGCDA